MTTPKEPTMPNNEELIALADEASERELKDVIVMAMSGLYDATKLIGGPTFGQYADAIIAGLKAKARKELSNVR